MMKNVWDSMCRQMAFNLFRGAKVLATSLRNQERSVSEAEKAQGA